MNGIVENRAEVRFSVIPYAFVGETPRRATTTTDHDFAFLRIFTDIEFAPGFAGLSAHQNRERIAGCGREGASLPRVQPLLQVSTAPHVLDSRRAERWESLHVRPSPMRKGIPLQIAFGTTRRDAESKPRSDFIPFAESHDSGLVSMNILGWILFLQLCAVLSVICRSQTHAVPHCASRSSTIGLIPPSVVDFPGEFIASPIAS